MQQEDNGVFEEVLPEVTEATEQAEMQETATVRQVQCGS